ncbi:Conserved secreted protein [Caenorhabditis elegans]|uniref:Conserved secreted protein n=1 Tax=Caenorhabditis elegans TaxID=6239 RepID=O16267_CAEEL|nr:Conserved secreted protein [Caenorhabditis elegans]CCD66963.1 Conserved secreted protein [Caenorhabditis elegans]|eukprot:NP_505033.2 Uncharacterized protein CELE_F40A3.1 [Caenorhabditis elegans]
MRSQLRNSLNVVAVIILLLPTATWQNHLEINDWELIGSRTYSWKGNEVLRCKHWDKVAIRWHLSTCTEHGVCDGGTNVDYATRAQNWTEMPVWRNAFTYVQIPGQLQKTKFLRLGLTGYDSRKTQLEAFSPLKIDVDWRWQVTRDGCNNFVVRMSAMSMINEKMRPKLERFCRLFDKDHFVDCTNL